MKTVRLFSFLFLLFAFAQTSLSCECKGVAPLTIVECRKFESITKCKIDSVKTCSGDKSLVYVHVLEMYKGALEKNLVFSYDCSSSCMMSFAKDEIWLFYAKKANQNNYELNLCDRNRKFISNAKEDYYTVNTGLSFDAEIAYLKKNIGFKILQEENRKNNIDITQRENDETSGVNKLIMLAVSLLLFLAMYYVVNKKLK